MKSFFKEAISSLRTSGTIKPSSKYLIRDCLKDLNFDQNKVIVEFGAGNGCITNEILNNINNESTLYSFEINQIFYNYCEKKFGNHRNFYIEQKSAMDFDKILISNEIDKVDYIISSLPLQLFNERDVAQLLRKVSRYLKEDGCFVQYQYSLGKYRTLKKIFHKTEIDFTLRNLPPAFIYKCYKQ